MELREIGQWWGTDSKKKKQIQIDIVGTPVEGGSYIIGSCKYKNEKIGLDGKKRIQTVWRGILCFCGCRSKSAYPFIIYPTVKPETEIPHGLHRNHICRGIFR